MNDNGFESSDPIVRGLIDAFRSKPRSWNRPVLPARTLMQGSLTGFSAENAEVILLDHDSQVYLNELWTIHFECTGEDLPLDMRRVIERERVGDGPKWNVRVAHAAGRGWSDDDFDAQIEQWLSSRPYSSAARIATATRGSTAPSDSESADGPRWESYFRTQHFLILLHGDDSRLIGRVQSETRAGRFTVRFEWPDSMRREVVVDLMPGDTWQASFVIKDAPAQLPRKASICGAD